MEEDTERMQELENGVSAVKLCLLDPIPWTHCSCGYIHKHCAWLSQPKLQQGCESGFDSWYLLGEGE